MDPRMKDARGLPKKVTQFAPSKKALARTIAGGWTGDKLLMRGTGIFKVIERRDGQQKPFKRASQDA